MCEGERGELGLPQYKLGEGPYGSAYQGTIDDLFGSGDLAPIEIGKRTFGLFLGQFDWVQTIRLVWQQPARGILGWLKWLVHREHKEDIPQVQVCASPVISTICLSPARARQVSRRSGEHAALRRFL